ncbi:MAG: hypothetical protein MJ237_00380 [bacterium]|nr:hypothetical protein [bacterium]
MEKGFIENGFIINLSTSRNTNQLIYELSNILEHPDVKGKRVCLKLGSIDLKQSQLLSIKALIEATDAEIAFIETTSEQTEVSATSLGISISQVDNGIDVPVQDEKEELETDIIPATDHIGDEEEDDDNLESQRTKEDVADINSEETEYKIIFAEEIKEINPINTLDGIEDTYTESSQEEISQIIPAENADADFETFAINEGLIKKEEAGKYILLDTGDVLPTDIAENTKDTKDLPTLYLNQTLRSGQTVTYEGNILIIGDAHPGSEIIAEGDITVWGILGGIAHSGCKGNSSAKVRALKLNAIQLRIAGLYARRNDTLNVPYVQKSNNFTPEEAQIENGKIVIYKKLRRD